MPTRGAGSACLAAHGWEHWGVQESSVGVPGSGASLSELVSLLMLRPPHDREAYGDAMTTQQASEVLGVDRLDVAAAWRAVAATHVLHAREVQWSARLGTALERLEGLATLRELAAASARLDGSVEPEHAYALSRVTVETNLDATLAWRRSGVSVFVCRTFADRGGATDQRIAPDPYVLMAQASELRYVVRALASNGDVVGASRLEHAVAIAPELNALGAVSGARLSDLVAAQVPQLLRNRRGDLYLAGLKPVHALSAVAKSLPPRPVTADEIRRRVRARFPEAAPLPEGTEFDEVVLMATGRAGGPSGYEYVDE